MRWLILLLAISTAAACSNGAHQSRARTREAKRLIANNCAACHQVPGVAAAHGRVGPSLAHIGRQQILAGHLANTPGEMVRWIEHPQSVLPGDAMPEMGLSHDDVLKIVDYLYTMD
jgi:cytochrome c1